MRRRRRRRNHGETEHGLRQPPQRRDAIGAKHKLNSAHVLGALAAAGLVAGLSGSFGVFVVAAAALIAAAWHAGDIRR